MPPDMREWLPAEHSVWVLIDAVGLMDTSELHARFKAGGAGRAGYDPDMSVHSGLNDHEGVGDGSHGLPARTA